MSDPAIQSNAVYNGGTATTVSAAFTGSNTLGNTLVAAVWTRDVDVTTMTITDTAGNSWPGVVVSVNPTPVPTWSIWLFVLTNCKAGANTVTSTTDVAVEQIITIIELPPASGVRVSNSAQSTGSAVESVTLAGTAVGDVCVGFISQNNATNTGLTVGSNPGFVQTLLFDLACCFDGVSSGGTIALASTLNTTSWAMIGLALTPLGPTINTQPSSANVVIGSTATFTVSATASAGSLSYQWKRNGTNVSGGSGGTTASYTTPALTVDNNRDVYTCVVTDSNGSTTTSGAVLTDFWNVTGSLSAGAIGTLAIGELPASGTNYTATISESATGPTDAVARAVVNARSVSESAGAPTDAQARAVVNARGLSESVTAPSDTVARSQGVARAIAESIVGPSDALSRLLSQARAIAESVVGPSDTAARVGVFNRSLAESVFAPSDALSRSQGTTRAVAESITAPSDAVSRAVQGARSVAESATAPSDAVTRVLQTMRSVAESVGAPSDAVARATPRGRAVAESVGAPSDVVARVAQSVRAVTESIGAPSDAVSRIVVIVRSVVESAGAPNDVIQRVLVAARNVLEAIVSPSDAVSHGGVVQTIFESIPAPFDQVVAVVVRYIVFPFRPPASNRVPETRVATQAAAPPMTATALQPSNVITTTPNPSSRIRTSR